MKKMFRLLVAVITVMSIAGGSWLLLSPAVQAQQGAEAGDRGQ